jgi:hypothetical protein
VGKQPEVAKEAAGAPIMLVPVVVGVSCMVVAHRERLEGTVRSEGDVEKPLLVGVGGKVTAAS